MPVLTSTGHVKIDRMDSRSQMQCLKECGDLLSSGASVLFFPEGTRSKDGKLHAFKKVRCGEWRLGTGLHG